MWFWMIWMGECWLVTGCNWYYLGLFWDAIHQRQVSLFDMGDLMVEFWQGVGFWLEHPHFMDLYGIVISQLIMEGDDHQHLGIQQPISSIINWWLSHPFEDLRRKKPRQNQRGYPPRIQPIIWDSTTGCHCYLTFAATIWPGPQVVLSPTHTGLSQNFKPKVYGLAWFSFFPPFQECNLGYSPHLAQNPNSARWQGLEQQHRNSSTNTVVVLRGTVLGRHLKWVRAQRLGYNPLSLYIDNMIKG